MKSIAVDNKTISLLEASVCDKSGEVSFGRLNTVLRLVAAQGGLKDRPSKLAAITNDGYPIWADINYDGAPQIWSIGTWSTCPNLDVFLTNLVKAHDPGTVSSIIVVEPTVNLKPYGQNTVDDSVERIDDNPYIELEKFAGKKYDGSLNLPELKKFKGFWFGRQEKQVLQAYEYSMFHRDKDLGVLGWRETRPRLGEKVEDLYDSDWEIQAIKHKGFVDESDRKKSEFRQKLNLVLKFLEYHLPLTADQKRQKIIDDDKSFWQDLAKSQSLDLTEILAGYTDKDPVTPWYRALDKQSGAKFTMGWRWRVDEIGVDFKKSVSGSRLNYLFGDERTTKYVDGDWTGGEVGPDQVTSFIIHAWSRGNTKKYLSQLLGVAREAA